MLSASFLQSIPFDFFIQGSDRYKFRGTSDYSRRLVLDLIKFPFFMLSTIVPYYISIFENRSDKGKIDSF